MIYYTYLIIYIFVENYFMTTKEKAEQASWYFIKGLIVVSVIFVIYLLAFGKKSKNSIDVVENTNSQSNTPYLDAKNSGVFKRTVYVDHYPTTIELTVPENYEEGATCEQCLGDGVEVGIDGKNEAICSGCMGKGFHWEKKR